MNWTALTALAEILGAIGVIASLLYLSRQVRHNTEATRLAMSHSISAAVRDWNRPLVEDATLMRVFYLGVEGSTELDETERARFLQLCWSFLRMFEDAHYQFRRGALDQQVWEANAKQWAVYAKAPGIWSYFVARREVFQPAFCEFLDRLEPPPLTRLHALVKEAGLRGDRGAR